MRKWILGLLMGGGIVILALVVYPVMLLGGAFDSCATTVYQRVLSPDGKVEARVQMTDCGATTGFSRVIWVKQAGSKDDDGQECRALALEGEPRVQLNWDGKFLNIRHDAIPSDVTSTSAICLGHRMQNARITN